MSQESTLSVHYHSNAEECTAHSRYKIKRVSIQNVLSLVQRQAGGERGQVLYPSLYEA